MSGATPKVNTAQEGAENSIPIKCGQKTAVFYPMKMEGMGKQGKGKQVGKCVQFQGKWLTPNEFERIAGATAKKWKQSINHDGKPLGEWLALNKLKWPLKFLDLQYTNILASYPGHFFAGEEKRPGTICWRMRQITQNLGNSDTRGYFQRSFPLHVRLCTCTCMGLYTMAGLSKCVDEFSEESLVA